ncbi:hypothetical protein GMD88_02325 [Pseudoflavonifractor sp. BIOML-A6]|jgi:hypothetical protein|nr:MULTISPECIES: hypothetical protein [unclassified Pseudoflavonifractor]MTQ95585.1 hypothetical protein [Pseudoflavonifractor sp. BIOML-A16]MTR05465.1 hypothetical protein [Pseudoflavonifractor sp. BIOML-A15]MTR73343.1 hypothetical protein [Pseudoflavonifractor sp. BIOML-A18]MTS64073.1 hypothetical protein [Pseudoflavonifractor sp. BIOML-A5]MTS72073.1 hypothetical protein [Pseudoflavonifractor sp. BIOML-A8]MTS89543.1 hypothetical protein [Pseudoflavonifractor sp. BIOML-A4]
MAKKRNIFIVLACFAAIVGIAAAITLHAGAEKGASSERDGLVSCPHYSLRLPLSRDYIQNDGSGYFFADERAVGGVNRLEKGLTPGMDEINWVTAEYEDLAALAPAGETMDGDLRTMERGLNAFGFDTTDGRGAAIDHVFVVVGNGLIFDFWVYRDAFTEEEIKTFENSIVLGGEWSRQPSSNRFITLYQPGGNREGTYQPNIGSSWCYLWEEDEDGITLLEVVSTGFGGLSAGTARDPIWSPDGQRLVITVETLDMTTFYFPLERFQVEVPFPNNRKDLRIPFYMSHWEFDYTLADVPRAVFFPLQWSDDSEQILFHFAWTDSEGLRRSGNAWFVLDAEKNHQIQPA